MYTVFSARTTLLCFLTFYRSVHVSVLLSDPCETRIRSASRGLLSFSVCSRFNALIPAFGSRTRLLHHFSARISFHQLLLRTYCKVFSHYYVVNFLSRMPSCMLTGRVSFQYLNFRITVFKNHRCSTTVGQRVFDDSALRVDLSQCDSGDRHSPNASRTTSVRRRTFHVRGCPLKYPRRLFACEFIFAPTRTESSS